MPAEPPLIDKGRPTRRARVLYVCESSVGNAYATLITSVVGHYLAIVDFLNGGTHRVGMSDDRIHAMHVQMQRRAEDLLLLLMALRRMR